MDCDDGDACTVDSCNADDGTCVHDAITCDDGVPCTDDRCDTSIGCVFTAKDCDDGRPCSDDYCQPHSGVCINIERCQDADLCTHNTCAEETGECLTVPINCRSEDPCKIGYCDVTSGECAESQIPNCPLACVGDEQEPECLTIGEGEPCVIKVECNEQTNECNFYCNTETNQCNFGLVECPVSDDLCVVSGCMPGEGCFQRPIECVTDLCDERTCNSQTGQCESIATTDCDDGNACTIDTCEPSVGCVYVPIICGEDGDVCTTERCDTDSERCLYVVTECDDGKLCTVDACDPETGDCVYDPEVLCPDIGSCLGQRCEEGHLCANDPLVKCATNADCCPADNPTCAEGRCELAELKPVCILEPVVCDDGNSCTLDFCEASDGDCVYAPITCDDGNGCTEDLCDEATGCTHVTKVCDDGDICTFDLCQTHDGECVYPPRCQDCDACTIDECNDQTGECSVTFTGCTPGPCETSYCDPVSGECVPEPIASCPLACDPTGEPGGGDEPSDECVPLGDGDPCVVVTACNEETSECNYSVLECGDPDNKCDLSYCLPGQGCVQRSVECAADACISLTCDPQTGLCEGDPVVCDDGNLCTVDICDRNEGCQHIPIYCGDDGDVCTDEVCEPASGTCTTGPAACDDGKACTKDACVPGSGCSNQPIPGCEE